MRWVAALCRPFEEAVYCMLVSRRKGAIQDLEDIPCPCRRPGVQLPMSPLSTQIIDDLPNMLLVLSHKVFGRSFVRDPLQREVRQVQRCHAIVRRPPVLNHVVQLRAGVDEDLDRVEMA